MRCAAAIVIAFLLTAPLYGDEVTDAKRAFVSGMKHFDLGEYDQALSDFKNGYRAKEDPVFLYNVAQCYRMMNQNRDAIRYYRLYLSRAPDATNRGEIEDRITKLQQVVDSENKNRQPETAPVTPPQSPPRAEVASAIPPPTVVARQPPTRTPAYKKWWVWTIVGVVAVGAGVGLGVGLTRGSSSSETTFPPAGF